MQRRLSRIYLAYALQEAITGQWRKKKMAMAGKVSVATKISNYRVLKALRAQDAFLPFLFFFFGQDQTQAMNFLRCTLT